VGAVFLHLYNQRKCTRVFCSLPSGVSIELCQNPQFSASSPFAAIAKTGEKRENGADEAYFCGIPSDFATFSCIFDKKAITLPQNLRYYCE